MTTRTTFDPADIEALRPTMKVGLLATVNPQGLPHLTLIASLQASAPRQVIFGQFIEGMSKSFVRDKPQVGFMVMTLDKNLWRGKARFTHTARQGPEFEMYNNTPMFRYNAYFGVHTVYYLDLVEQSGRSALPMGQVVLAAVKTMVARRFWPAGHDQRVLNRWTRALLNKLDNLKFLTYIGQDGFPWIVPAIQAQAAGSEHVLLSSGVYREELAAIPPGTPVAMLGMSLQMEDVLLRGEWQGLRRVGGLSCGVLQVDWVYNPMPPTPQQIYPPLPLRPVTNF